MDEIARFLSGIVPAKRQRDARTLLGIMRDATGEEPKLDRGMLRFGTYHYRYASGREGDAAAAAFAPRKAATTVYLLDGVGAHEADLAALGPHTTGVGCLYLKDLSLIDHTVLRRIIRNSYATVTTGDFYGKRAREGHGRAAHGSAP